MAVQLMKPAIRKTLYAAKMAQDLAKIAESVSMPPSPAKLIAEVNNQLQKSLRRLECLGKNQMYKSRQWTRIQVGKNTDESCSCVSRKYDTKSSSYENPYNESSKRKNTQSSAAYNRKSQEEKTLKGKMQRLAREFAQSEIRRIQSDYYRQIYIYKSAVAAIKGNYEANGRSRKDIDYRCDAIDHKFEEAQTIAKNIPKHIVKMSVQAPMPGAVGMCGPNPGYGIVTLLINTCTVLSMLMRLIKLLMSIKDDIEYFFGFFDLSRLSAFNNLMSTSNSILYSLNNVSTDYIKHMKSTAIPCHFAVYSKSEGTYVEDYNVGKPDYYKIPSNIKTTYEKFNGIDVLQDAEITEYKMYWDRDMSSKNYIGRSTTGLLRKDGAIVKDSNTTTVTLTADGKRSIISMANGRRVVIDKVVKTGDVVKLNDGTIIVIS